MDRNLALEVVRVTEAAAMAAGRDMGRGERDHADHLAVEAMRRRFDTIDIRGTVVIGEGERDEAPMLYIGEKVGGGWNPEDERSPKIDIAVDPLEGTNLCATGAPDALAVIAMAKEGEFLNAPDTYKDVRDLTAIILERDRHKDLIAETRQAGARIRLIGDGDVAGAIMTVKEDSGIDVLMGTGGAPEGVIAAAALRCVGGDMQARLKWRSEEERARGIKMGVSADDKIYQLNELAKGDVLFAATGVTKGYFLDGVTYFGGGCKTQAMVMRSQSGTVRIINSTHRFKPIDS